MENLFHLKENGTTAKTEIVAGFTTFMTMAYIQTFLLIFNQMVGKSFGMVYF